MQSSLEKIVYDILEAEYLKPGMIVGEGKCAACRQPLFHTINGYECHSSVSVCIDKLTNKIEKLENSMKEELSRIEKIEERLNVIYDEWLGER